MQRHRLLTILALVAALVRPGPAQCEDGSELVVAVNRNDVPFAYTDDAGNLTGFGVDLAQALCAAAAFRCRLEPTVFAEMIPGVAAGRYDFAVGNVLRTAEREQLVDFTARAWRSTSVFVGRPGSVRSTEPEALAGKTVAVQKGSVQERYLRLRYSAYVSIAVFDTNVERNAAVATGAADLLLGSISAAYQFLKTPQGEAFDLVGDPISSEGLGGDVAIPVAKGREALLHKLNNALVTLQRTGALARIGSKYFPVSIY